MRGSGQSASDAPASATSSTGWTRGPPPVSTVCAHSVTSGAAWTNRGTRTACHPPAGARIARAPWRGGRLLQRVEQGLPLAVAEACRPARGVDARLLQQGVDLRGPVAGQALQQVRDLGLADDLIGLRPAEHRRDRLLAGRDRVAQLLAGGAGGRGL